MEKKGSVGVTISATIMLIYSFLFFFISYIGSKSIYHGLHLPEGKQYFNIGELFIIVLITLGGLTYLVSGINILRLKNWARIIVVYFSGIIFFITIISFILLSLIMFFAHTQGLAWGLAILLYISLLTLPSSSFLYFFTRPKVKALFSPSKL